MRYPLKIEDALVKLRAGAWLTVVVHGEREWSWAQVSGWSQLDDVAVLMVPPDVAPGALDWSVVRSRKLLVLTWSELYGVDDPDLIAALLRQQPARVDVIDLSDPWAIPMHIEWESGAWRTWVGHGKRGEIVQEALTEHSRTDPSGSSSRS